MTSPSVKNATITDSNDNEVYEISDTEFKIMIIRIMIEIKEDTNKHINEFQENTSKHLNEIKKIGNEYCQYEIKKTI
jgi:hypothetical protein